METIHSFDTDSAQGHPESHYTLDVYWEDCPDWVSVDDGYVLIATHLRDNVTNELDPRAQATLVKLDRGGVNALIKCLRQARDQAFGVDA